MKRGILKWALLGVAAAGALAVVVMLGASMAPSRKAAALALATIDVSAVAPGDFRRFEATLPIFVYRPRDAAWEEVRSFDRDVQDPKIQTFVPELGVFVVIGVGTFKEGGYRCVLNYAPEDQPPIVALDFTWRGGYVDMCRGAVYDYAGRALRVGATAPNLEPVTIRSVNASVAELQLFGS